MWRSVQKVINEECSLSHVVYSVIDEITSLVVVSHLIWFRLLEGYGGGTCIRDVDIVAPMAYKQRLCSLEHQVKRVLTLEYRVIGMGIFKYCVMGYVNNRE